MKFDRLVLFGFSAGDLAAPLGAALERALRLRAGTLHVAADARELGDADALVLQLGTAADRALFESAPHLRYVGVFGTDQSRVDADAAAARGIVVRNVPGYSTDSVAEFAIAAMLERFRRLEAEKARARSRDLGDGPGGTTLGKKRLGVVGFGRIGRRVAEIARAGFGAEVLYWSRTRRPELERAVGVAWRELAELSAGSDAVAVHLPLTRATEGLIGREVLGRAPPGSVWVHLSPMEIVDLDALDERLAAGDFAFVLDHADELAPSALDRLSRHPGLVAYPPVACNTDTAREQKLRTFVADLDAFLEGRSARDGSERAPP